MEQAKKVKDDKDNLGIVGTRGSQTLLTAMPTSLEEQSKSPNGVSQPSIVDQPVKARHPLDLQQVVSPQVPGPNPEQPISETGTLKRRFSRTLSVSSIFVPVAFFLYCLWSYSRVSPGLDIREFRELEKTALQINLDASNSLANLTVGLLGGVWALVLGLEKKPRITVWELVPLIGGSSSLILSYVSYRMGLVKYVEMLFDAETVDISAGFVKHWPTWQFVFFIYGFVVLVIALLTVYRRT